MFFFGAQTENLETSIRTLILTARRSTLVVRIYRREILTSKVDPRTVGVNLFIMVVDP